MSKRFKKALSIRQPWAWLIAHGYKKIENRSWNTSFRGRFLIHASQRLAENCAEILEFCAGLGIPMPPDEVDVGCVVGVATLVDVVESSDDPFFLGPLGYLIADAHPIPPIECEGKLKFFDVDVDVDVEI